MKVRFRNPDSSADLRHGGPDVDMAPARRPLVPAWRWYLMVLLVAAVFLVAVVRFFSELLGLKGSGYLIYPTQDLLAPASVEVQQLLVKEGGEVRAGTPLLQGRIRSASPGSDAPASDRLTLTAHADGVAERIRVRPGQQVPADAPLLSLRTKTPPFVQAWMGPEYLGRLWVGRPALVRLPDGSRLAAVIAEIMASTEKLPEGLSGPGRPGHSSLVVRLRLQDAVQTQINFLPVEVRLRWRDDFSRWTGGFDESKESPRRVSVLPPLSPAAGAAFQRDR